MNLREGDQVMVKVLAIEGNRIKLSRKALIKEQKAKLAQTSPAGKWRRRGKRRVVCRSCSSSSGTGRSNEFDERQPKSNQSTILIEGGDDFDEAAPRSSTRRPSRTSIALTVRLCR